MALFNLEDRLALPWRAIKIVGAVVLLLFIWWAISQLTGHSVGKANQKAETATDGKVAAEQTTAGTLDVQNQAEEGRATVGVVKERTAQVATQARTAPGGETPLPAATAARLRSHDDFLCQSRPAICEGRGDVGPAPR